MKKIVIVIFIFFSCHNGFDNPVDPESKNYIGHSAVLGVNVVELLTCKGGESVLSPNMSWSAIDNSTYMLQISKNENFSLENIVYTEITDKNYLSVGDCYVSKGWPYRFSSLLDNIPTGKYFWRVSVSNPYTGFKFSSWSKIGFFNLRLKKIFSCWEDESLIIYYSYTNDELAIRESTFSKFGTTENHIETVVKVYDPEKNIIKEDHFNDTKCKLENLRRVVNFKYSSDIFQNQNIKIIKNITTEDSLDFFNMYEVKFYDGSRVAKIEKWYEKVKNGGADFEKYLDMKNSGKYYIKEKRDYIYYNNKLTIMEVYYYSYLKDSDSSKHSYLGYYTIEDGNIVKYENYGLTEQGDILLKNLTYNWTMSYYDGYKGFHKEAIYFFPIYTEGTVVNYNKLKKFIYNYNF